ncbi:MAG TPA: carboxypeptidase-like regulatory domain-containing protein, partial [Pyrinomonadaceae bacterium]|nr:carboxypeptidase-like regulatory domain-containing protein [Pyrinomonadaceae bacterium]
MSRSERQHRSGIRAVLSDLLVLSFLYLISLPVSAQSVTGTISGTVVDSAGQAVAGARIALSDERTAGQRTATANEEGYFTFATVQPGIYTIKIEHQGFRSYQRTNNVLSANEQLALGKLTLDIGNLTEVVTTIAEGAVAE